MRNIFKPSRAAMVFAGSLIAVVTGSGSAGAVTDTAFKYTTPKTGAFTIGIMALRPNNPASGGSYMASYATGSFTGVGCYNAGVNLPNGATITKVAVFYKSGATSNVSAILDRFPLAGGASENVALNTIADDSDTRKMAVFSPFTTRAVVNSQSYAYGMGFCIGSGDTIYAARITYTYGNAGD